MSRPFFTRKPTGMGLGLYYANLAMELNGGQLVFPQPDEVDLPPDFDGAVIALIFKTGR
jgi:nitrogen fixation/metabolism regulation signal transduction histidine kinase